MLRRIALNRYGECINYGIILPGLIENVGMDQTLVATLSAGVTMLKLPYGVSSFDKLVRDDYYFVDRTSYIAQLEQLVEPYLFFLRPRRFGKSLFISLLQCYYGLEYAADFTELFGGYAIG